MFRLRTTKKTVDLKVVADEMPSSSQSVPVTLASVPAQPAETGESQKPERKQRKGLFSIFKKKKKPEEKPPAPLDSDTSSDVQTPTRLPKKTPWWRRPLTCCKRKKRVPPVSDPDGQKTLKESSSAVKEETQEIDLKQGSSSVSLQEEVVPLSPEVDPDVEECNKTLDDPVPSDISVHATIEEIVKDFFNTFPLTVLDATTTPVPAQPAETGEGQTPERKQRKGLFSIFKEKKKSEEKPLTSSESKKTKSDDRRRAKRTIVNFGFPNPGETCYLNSSLQSLLPLKDFFASIRSAEPVWSSVPGTQLLRQLCQIQEKHASTSDKDKCRLLSLFKDTVSAQAPEFDDDEQKDAHEFLTSVLDQIQGLCPLLKDAAAGSGTTYTCPVEENMAFWMENTRTCKECGAHTTTREKFTNISLDLIPGGTIEEMLQAYQKEEDLECSCQCGGRISSRISTLDTLPGVLIVHMKRFRFTPKYTLEKVLDSVQIQRDVVVSSNQGGGCYSLVSAISHFGTTDGGHYIADALHPDDSPYEPTDRWLTLDDSDVEETVGSSVCKQRKMSAYVLFYKRHV